jgi:cbb3-type cytochrome oxidase cytochrome c subunit
MVNLLTFILLLINIVILILYWRRDQNIVYSVFSFSIIILFGLTIYKDFSPEWKEFQREYKNMLLQVTPDPEQKKQVEKISFKIKQIWNPELGIADRCITCHLGVSDPRFSNAPQPYKTHPRLLESHQIQKFGCTVCHQGQGRATEKKDAHGNVIHWEKPILNGSYVQASCIKCHFDKKIEDAYLLSRGVQLMKESGCFGCHNITAFQPERIKIGPDLERIGSKVNPEWIVKWIKNPKSYLPDTRMPDALLSDENVKAIASFLLNLTDSSIPPEPMMNDKLTLEARLEKGRKLIESSRCANCHKIEGIEQEGFVKVEGLGPSLINIKVKAKKGWVVEWLKNTQGLHTNTMMPTFNFTDDQALAITEYLMNQRGELTPVYQETKIDITGDDLKNGELANTGKKLIQEYGCFGCHNVKGIDAKIKIGPDLDGIGSKELEKFDFGKMIGKIGHTKEDWIFTKLKQPRAFTDILKMPSFGFSDEDARAITSALLGFVEEPIPVKYIDERTKPAEFVGSFGRLIKKYKCYSCHRIKGFGGDIGPDLSFEGSKVKKEWLLKFLKEPYKLNPLLSARMPNFFMPDEDIKVIADFIELSLATDKLSHINLAEEYNEDNIKKGESLFKKKYGCIACHYVEGAEIKGKVGPDLNRVGSRLNPDWIFSWLKNPQALHPNTIMPNFNLPDKVAAPITAYLVSLK